MTAPRHLVVVGEVAALAMFVAVCVSFVFDQTPNGRVLAGALALAAFAALISSEER